jgi:hypothetical protein
MRSQLEYIMCCVAQKLLQLVSEHSLMFVCWQRYKFINIRGNTYLLVQPEMHFAAYTFDNFVMLCCR